jgi:hypothetical protein
LSRCEFEFVIVGEPFGQVRHDDGRSLDNGGGDDAIAFAVAVFEHVGHFGAVDWNRSRCFTAKLSCRVTGLAAEKAELMLAIKVKKL